jgi:acetylornithine deacetylase/succinyl-diaminopimelate desuccinylase-like protein
MGAIDIVERSYKADAVIVGEPTGKDRISIARKGLEWIDLKFKGVKVHGGMQDQGVNAIEMATRFINVILTELKPKLKERVVDLPGFGHSTVNLGHIEGGDQPSTVAGECLLQIDRRWMPGIETYEGMWQEIQDIIDRLHAEDERFQCEMSIHKESKMKDGYVHLPAVQDIDSDIVKITRQNAEKAIGRAPDVVGSVGGWDDTGILKNYGGMDCITYGPGTRRSAIPNMNTFTPTI